MTNQRLIKYWTKIALKEHRDIYGANADQINRHNYTTRRVQELMIGYEHQKVLRLAEIEEELQELDLMAQWRGALRRR